MSSLVEEQISSLVAEATARKVKKRIPGQQSLNFWEQNDGAHLPMQSVPENKNVQHSELRPDVREDVRGVSAETPGDAKSSGREVPSDRQGLIEQIIRDERVLREGLWDDEWEVPFFEGRIEMYLEAVLRLDATKE